MSEIPPIIAEILERLLPILLKMRADARRAFLQAIESCEQLAGGVLIIAIPYRQGGKDRELPEAAFRSEKFDTLLGLTA